MLGQESLVIMVQTNRDFWYLNILCSQLPNIQKLVVCMNHHNEPVKLYDVHDTAYSKNFRGRKLRGERLFTRKFLL